MHLSSRVKLFFFRAVNLRLVYWKAYWLRYRRRTLLNEPFQRS